MIFDYPEEYDDLINEISNSMKTKKKKKKKKENKEEPPKEDDPVGGSIPLDEVLPPSAGHSVGPRVPNTSAYNQPYDGGPWIEGIEDRFCKIIEEIQSDNDLTVSKQKEAHQGQVGMVGVLGHSKGDKEPRTAAAAHRQAVDPYATAGKAKRKTKSLKKPEEQSEEEIEKEMKDTLEKLEQPNEIESPADGNQMS